MKRISSKQRENGMRYCTYCKDKGLGRIDAVWRERGGGNLACEAHRDNLAARENDDHMTEADYQTWWRL